MSLREVTRLTAAYAYLPQTEGTFPQNAKKSRRPTFRGCGKIFSLRYTAVCGWEPQAEGNLAEGNPSVLREGQDFDPLENRPKQIAAASLLQSKRQHKPPNGKSPHLLVNRKYRKTMRNPVQNPHPTKYRKNKLCKKKKSKIESNFKSKLKKKLK
jgi:hypothetical protein